MIGTSEKVNWIHLQDIAQLDEIESSDQSFIIVKHSTRCSISSMVINRFEKDYDLSSDKLKPYFLDLIKYRSISNEIAARYDVLHQSPQILLIQNGACKYHASHNGIDLLHLKTHL